jgi:ATP-binding cassette subfamily B multidrug efflux pump
MMQADPSHSGACSMSRDSGSRMGMEEKPKVRDFKGTIIKLLGYLRKFKVAKIVVFVIASASTAATIAGPKILGEATTTLFTGVLAKISGSGSIDFARINQIVAITHSLHLISALFSYLQGWIMADVSTNITYRLRRDISEKINRLPLKYFDEATHGEVLSRITNDVDTVNQTLNQSLTQIITSLITVIGVLVMMLSISWQMTLVALLIIPLSLGVIGLVINQSQNTSNNNRIILATLMVM